MGGGGGNLTDAYSTNTLLHAGLDPEVSVHLQLAFILAVTAFVLCLEFVVEKIEDVIERHPTYWTLLNKMYRELLVGGLTAFASKRIDQWNATSNNTQVELNFSDDIVLYFSLSIALQSGLMFMMLRRRNLRLDELSLLNARDLLDYMGRGGSDASSPAKLDPTSRLAQSVMKMKLLQHFFLRTYQLPDLFSFSKYLRAIQDSEIFSLFDVEIIEWILLVALYTLFFSLVDAYEHIPYIVESASDDEIIKGVSLVNGKHLQRVRLTILLLFILVLTVALVVLYRFVRGRVHDIVVHAGGGHASYVDALQVLATAADNQSTQPTTHDDAIHAMQELADSLSDVEDRSSIWALVQSAFRRVVGKAHAKPDRLVVADLQLRFFSRKAVHVVAKILLSLNAMYFALVWATFNASIAKVIASREAWWYPVCLVGIMALLVVNMLVLAPRLVRQLALVNATVRVNPHELKAVVEHFSDVLDMQTKMADAVAEYCDAHDKDLTDMRRDVEAADGAGSGLVDIEVLRHVIKKYGFKFSKTKFQTFVRLQFSTRGRNVPYNDFFAMLVALMTKLAAESEAEDDNRDVFVPDVTPPHHVSHHESDESSRGSTHGSRHHHDSMHGKHHKETSHHERPPAAGVERSASGSFRRPKTADLLRTLSAYDHVNAEDDLARNAAYVPMTTPAVKDAVAPASPKSE
ncbi:Aste57867_13263 [Aphanomyces stellatus]|uniref:Aste57867_13263 protein n=1 Tax=Aphanomyces stellatus TaxID=120398 RepID=A0A485KYJ6_9STRA|nr:hypothetical protein As57867_013214 [Aphanomyces stellatus]VFT90103.1 Aste57867_13263 [Aphanomyces stellatus]